MTLVLLWWGMLAGTLSAQDPAPIIEPKPPEITKATIEARKVEVSENAALKEQPEQLKSILDQYDQALLQLQEAEKTQLRTNAFHAMKESTLSQVKTLKEQLAALPKEAKPLEIPANAEQAYLDQQLALAVQEQQTARERLKTAQEEEARRQARVIEVPKLLEATRGLLTQLDESLKVPPPPGEMPELTEARLLFQRARKRALEAEVLMFNEELPAYTATQERLALEIQLAERQLALAEAREELWTEAVARRQEEERQKLAAKTRQVAEEADDLLKPYAKANQLRAELRNGPEGLPAQIAQVEQILATRTEELQKLLGERQKTEEQLKIPGMEQVIGPRLLRQRRNLPGIRIYRHEIAERQKKISEARFAQMRIKEETEAIAKPELVVREILSGLENSLSKARRAAVEAEALAILKTKKELLDAQYKDYSNYINKLYELSAKEQELINYIDGYDELLGEHILWVKSTDALNGSHWKFAIQAGKWLSDWDNWQVVWQSLWADVLDLPWLWGLFVIAGIGMFYGHRRSRMRIVQLSGRVKGTPIPPFGVTLQCVLLVLLNATVLPLGIGFFGWRLSQASWSSEFVHAVGLGLQTVAWLLLLLDFFQRLCRRNGVAEVHFRWRRERLGSWSKHLRWLMVLGLPCVFVLTAMQAQARASFYDSLGRLSLMAVLLLIAIFIGRVVYNLHYRPSHYQAAKTQRTVWSWLAYSLVVVFPLGLCVICWVGYFYTATKLTERLMFTVFWLLTMMLIHSLALRWLFQVRGTFALKQTQDQNDNPPPASAAASLSPASTGTSKSPSPLQTVLTPGSPPSQQANPVVESVIEPIKASVQTAPAQSLATINAQTRRFLNIALVTLFALGSWAIWADVLPALGALDRSVWTTTQQIADPTGGESAPMVQTVKVVKVSNLLFALIVGTIGVLAARNLPGLLEVGVLQYLPLDSGSRYAASTLAKYLIMVVGIVVAMGMIGLKWSQVQWLAAALTVGLGFGMQEIFANFISGMILLFERPIRVGDVVTIGDVTGIITRIRIRATTLRNWDRKEFIVPNKELITGRLMNWTLSDPINRIVVNVRVAFGSDVELTRSILLEILHQQPEVMKDPAPAVTMEGFGENALNFVVRCFVPNMDCRLKVIHEVHTTINRRFNEEGIEISYPQRDLHLRSIDPRVALAFNGGFGNGHSMGEGTRSHSEPSQQRKSG